MKNYKLDLKLLPNVWVVWNTKRDNRTHYLNTKTGKQKYKPELWMTTTHRASGMIWNNTECNGNMWVVANSKCERLYAKYHKDIDKLELAIVTIDTCRKEFPRTWEFVGERYFIGKDKSVQCLNKKNDRYYEPRKNYYGAWGDKQLIRMLLNVQHGQSFINEFKKFIGAEYFTIGNGTTVDIVYAWHFQKWYETSTVYKTTGKQQCLVDELTSKTLSDPKEFAHKYPPKKIDEWRMANRFMYFEHIDEKWSVLRVFFIESPESVKETWRTYISDDTIRIAAPTREGWVPSRQPYQWYGIRTYFANVDEATEQCKRLKYVIDALKCEKEENFVDMLVKSLRFPEFEQLTKLGAYKIVESASNTYTPKAELKHIFGEYYNDKEKTVLRKVGLTKQQLDTVITLDTRRCRSVLREMRRILGNDLSYLDIVSFNKYFKLCREMEAHWNLKRVGDRLDVDETKFYKNLMRLAEKYPDAYTVMSDLIGEYYRLDYGTQPEIDWYFDNYSDMVRLHDAVDALFRQQEAERRARWDAAQAERLKKQEEKRKKLDEARQVYNYEENDFVIRLPKDLKEIVEEGSKQRMCIGGYTERHANGDTNIFFLRKTSEPDEPFYAIEMRHGDIVQIHGFGNKWLGNNPEAIPTVIRWLRKHGIKCSDKILTCTAHGYCSTNEYVPMPQVD